MSQPWNFPWTYMFHHLTGAWLKKLMEEPGLSPTINNQGLCETVKIMMAVVM